MRFLKFPRDPRGDRRGQGAKTRGFLRFLKFPRDPLRGSAWSRCKNPCFFLRCLRCPRDPLRGSAWLRCKNSRFFAISAVLAQPCAKTQGFLRLLLFELVLGSCLVVRAPAPGTGGSRVRFLPGPRAGVARCNLHFKATCAEQLAQSNLRRATCANQLAPTSARKAPCLEQLAQSNLRRATCTEQPAGSAICTEQVAGSHLQGRLAGATCAEQLAQCNLRRATCADQLAPTSLRRAPCLVLSRACFTNASWREKERILQRWADLACDVMLSGQPWSSLFLGGGVGVFRVSSPKAREGPSQDIAP